jgi:uncharacterized membrane protein
MFTTLIVLGVGFAGFRLLGMLGVGRFAGWAACAAHALAVLLVMTGTAHFVPAGVTVMPNHADLVAMVPPFVPYPDAMVYLTGVFELLGAAGLVLTATRRAAGLALAALFVALLPANIYAAVAGVPFHGREATPLWLRVPEQVVYVAVALWVARAASRPAATGPREQDRASSPR